MSTLTFTKYLLIGSSNPLELVEKAVLQMLLHLRRWQTILRRHGNTLFLGNELPPFQPGICLDFQALSETSPTANDECSDPPYGQCSFYADCLEARYHCGPNGYPIGYGLKYCEKFKAARSELSTQGQTWMLNTMKCLQDTLTPEATDDMGAVKTCEELSNKAFNSRAPCYLGNGLCALPPRDWLAIVNIVTLNTMFSSWEAVKEALEAGAGCSGF